jgi:uncharacterized delta-60 repeat protein
VLRFSAPFGVEVESFLALGLRRDGRLTVALQTSLGLVLGRFGYAGTPDTSLGRTGFRRLEPPSSMRVTAAAFDREDRLVVGGVRDDPFLEDYPSIAVSRFTGDGERDTSFGDRGVTATEPPGSTDATQVTSITVAPDLDVVLGAGLLYWSWDTAVLRTAADGRLEPTFGAGGAVRENLARPPYSENHSLNHDQPFDLAVLRDGRVVVTGWVAGVDERPELLVARLGRDGRPERGFGDDGVVRGPVREAGRAVAVQDDGRIVVGVGATPSRTVELAPSWGAVRLLGDVADLAVAFERPPGPAVPGTALPVALRVTNTGPSAVSRVEVETVLRAGGATSRAGGAVGTLGPGESTVVRHWLGVPPASGTATVQATVRGAAFDPDRGDDVVRARVAVADPPPPGGPAR